jgi:hypothetical protein
VVYGIDGQEGLKNPNLKTVATELGTLVKSIIAKEVREANTPEARAGVAAEELMTTDLHRAFHSDETVEVIRRAGEIVREKYRLHVEYDLEPCPNPDCDSPIVIIRERRSLPKEGEGVDDGVHGG